MIDLLVEIIKFDSSVRACLNRIENSVLSDYPTIYENGKRLKPEFATLIMPYYLKFIKNAIELFFFCGFVPYQICIRQKVRVPIALELGSFTWNVEKIKKPTEKDFTSNFKYTVNPRNAQFKAENVYFFNYVTPYHCSTGLHSPIWRIAQIYAKRKALEDIVLLSNEWNAQKHIAVTEKLDIKDQTLSGVQLLDQCRRYALSGVTGGQEQAMLRLQGRNSENLRNINDANAYWIRDQFAKTQNSSTDVHILPPNTEVHELSAQTGISSDLQFFDTLYNQTVFAYFDMPSATELSKKATSTSSEQMTRTQFSRNVAFCRVFERMCVDAYSNSMSVSVNSISVEIKAQSRLEVSDPADLKVLLENNVLTPLDRKSLRTMFGF